MRGARLARSSIARLCSSSASASAVAETVAPAAASASAPRVRKPKAPELPVLPYNQYDFNSDDAPLPQDRGLSSLTVADRAKMFELFLADPKSHSVANLASEHKITRTRVRAILQLQQHQRDFVASGKTLYTDATKGVDEEGEEVEVEALVRLDATVKGTGIASEVTRLDDVAPEMLLLGDDEDATAVIRNLRRDRKVKQIIRNKVPMRPTIANPTHNMGEKGAKHRYKTAFIALTDKKELKRQKAREAKGAAVEGKVDSMMIRDHDGKLRWATFNERRHRR